jgi:TrpR-related protein YerC/YecD
MAQSGQSPSLKKLWRILAELESEAEARDFLTDLCTPAELQAMAERWNVAQQITQGQNYRDIAEKTGCSTATVTRVGRSLKYGRGGYQWALQKVGLLP